MRLQYIEVNEEPELFFEAEGFRYRKTTFITRLEHVAQQKCVDLISIDKDPICLKNSQNGKFYILIKEIRPVQPELPVAEAELPESPADGDSEVSFDVGDGEQSTEKK